MVIKINPVKTPNFSPARRREVSSRELIRLLSTGLGEQVCVKRWKVLPRRTGLGCVTYGTRAIFGFNAKNGDVFSVIREEGAEIVAHFYNSQENAVRATGLLKTAVLSRKKKDETGQNRWSPLDQPEIIFSRLKTQKQKIETGRIKSFLLEELGEETKLEIAPRKVLKDGQVRFKIDGKFICIPGFQAQAETTLWGKIVVEGATKRVYFWKDRKRREAPLNPEGRVLAQKTNGKWEIVWSAASDNWRKQKQTAELYGNFLYATVNGKTFHEHWKVYKARDGQRIRSTAKKTIRGNVFQFEVPTGRSCNYVLSETREYGKALKVSSFWLSPEDFEAGKNPFDSRAIMFRPSNNCWQPFWRRLSDTRVFKKLLEEGQISYDHLESVLTEISGKHPLIFPVLDAIFIKG
jgi:hypothetical protein